MEREVKGSKGEGMCRMCGELDATHIFLIYGADIRKTAAGRRENCKETG
jgi:hypothetical protein